MNKSLWPCMSQGMVKTLAQDKKINIDNAWDDYASIINNLADNTDIDKTDVEIALNDAGIYQWGFYAEYAIDDVIATQFERILAIIIDMIVSNINDKKLSINAGPCAVGVNIQKIDPHIIRNISYYFKDAYSKYDAAYNAYSYGEFDLFLSIEANQLTISSLLPNNDVSLNIVFSNDGKLTSISAFTKNMAETHDSFESHLETLCMRCREFISSRIN